MKVCAISYKDCWKDEKGIWYSYGGFPLQMQGIRNLFDEMTLIITETLPREGGIPLPKDAQIVAIDLPKGRGLKRKINVVFHLLYYLKFLAKHIKKTDVVHTPLPGDIPLLGLIIGLWYRKKTIARYGGSWSTTTQTTFMNRVTKGIMRYYAGGNNVMLVTGNDPETLPGKNMHWLFSSGTTKAEIDAISINLKKVPGKRLQLVYIGRISPEKGLEILLKALQSLKKNIPSDQFPFLTIIGDGPSIGKIKQLSSDYELNNTIHFTGQLNKSDLYQTLVNKDICVQPSLTEGYSKAWIDALINGLPVISSNVGAATHVLGENGERGWLCTPGNVSELTGTLTHIIEDSTINWEKLRRDCRAFGETHTIEHWEQKIREICVKQWKIKDLKVY